MPRFVLLRHECPASFGKPSHWDFMFEWGDVLRTWDLRRLPTRWAELLEVAESADVVEAVALPDHRLDYLDYEGPLSGNRGTVTRCDGGTYEILNDDPSGFEVRLAGQMIRGTARIERTGERWRLSDIA